MPFDATVSMMLDNDNKWKMNLIQQKFSKEDADDILRIPLLRRRSEDRVIWHYDKKRDIKWKVDIKWLKILNF